MQLATIKVNMKRLEVAQYQYKMSMYGGGLGSFDTHLHQAIKYADTKNTHDIAKGFPHQVLASLLYLHGNKFDYFRDFYKLNFEFETNYISQKDIDVENLKERINTAWNEMSINKETTTIVEILVNSSEGAYVLNRVGDMFDIDLLKRDPYETEGFWEDWMYTVDPKCQEDLDALVIQNDLFNGLPNELYLTLNFTEDVGDFTVQLVLPEDYWGGRDDEVTEETY